MKIGYVQMNPGLHDIAGNLETMRRLTSGVEADLLVFPELCTTGYLFSSREQLADHAESVPGGESLVHLSELAQALECHLIVGLAEREGNRIYNSSVVIHKNGTVLTPAYRKLHLFWDEKDLFTPGDRPPLIHGLDAAAVGLMVCFDWAFPEVPRSLALLGADIICHSANLVLPYAQGAAVTRAIENRLFVVLANRVGAERLGDKELRFTGQSRIVAPGGDVLAESGQWQEEVRVVEIEPSLAKDKMLTPRNHALNDRRPDMYGMVCG